MRRTAIALALAGLFTAVLLESSAAAHTQPSLGSMLLTVNQMPTGWSVDNSPDSTQDLGCLSHLTSIGIKKTANATVTFALNGDLPSFSEQLSTYTKPASAVFDKGVPELDHCSTIHGTSGGHKITGTIGAMSFPRSGNQSAAWAISLTIEGLTVGEDVVVVRKGSILALFAEADLGSPDITRLQALVSKALAKVG